MRIPVLLLVILASIGCGNPFTRFYTGKTLAEADRQEEFLLPPFQEPTVMADGEVTQAMLDRYEDGWVALGGSSWTGPDFGSDADAIAHARKVGATLVVRSWRLLGSTTSSVPITVPTSTTTYGSGNVYGTYGTATWNGYATTYGTQTTYVPVTVHRYSAEAAFLAPRSRLPVFGILPRRMSPQEQSAAGTVDGLVVERVVRGGPAAVAGVLPGDVILEVAGERCSSDQAFLAAIMANRGKRVDATIVRGGEVRTIEVVLAP